MHIDPLLMAAGIGGIISITANIAQYFKASPKLVQHLNAAAALLGSTAAIFSQQKDSIMAVLSLLGGGIAYGVHLVGQEFGKRMVK